MAQLIVGLNRFVDILAPAEVAFGVRLDSGVKFNHIARLQVERFKLFGQVEPQMVGQQFAIRRSDIDQQNGWNDFSLPTVFCPETFKCSPKCSSFAVDLFELFAHKKPRWKIIHRLNKNYKSIFYNKDAFCYCLTNLSE